MPGVRRAAVLLLGTLTICASLQGCTREREVRRVDPERVHDLDYRFSEDDARMTAQTMVGDMLSQGWIDRWMGSREQRPVLILGTVRNDTRDYIDTQLFTKQIERALINSGRIRIVAARDDRGQVRDERAQIADWSRPETVKRMAHELGADLMLIGRVGENVQQSMSGRRGIQYYQVNMELIDIESNEVVWIGEQQIEKRVDIRRTL